MPLVQMWSQHRIFPGDRIHRLAFRPAYHKPSRPTPENLGYSVAGPKRRAVAALRRIDNAGTPINRCRRREANVSRTWLYNQPDLRAEIERLRGGNDPRLAPSPTGNAPPTRRCTNAFRSRPTASDSSKPTTIAYATPSPKRSVSDAQTPTATRRTNNIPVFQTLLSAYVANTVHHINLQVTGSLTRPTALAG